MKPEVHNKYVAFVLKYPFPFCVPVLDPIPYFIQIHLNRSLLMLSRYKTDIGLVIEIQRERDEKYFIFCLF